MESNKMNTLSQSQMDSTPAEVHHLINGTFSASDAKKVLLEMLHNKINFHNRQIQSIQEQTGRDTSLSENRIDELFNTTEKVKELLLSAAKQGLSVRIECPLLIQIK